MSTEHYPGEAHEAAADEASTCEQPCHPDAGCNICFLYWQRMKIEGYWKDGEWTAKGIKEMCK